MVWAAPAAQHEGLTSEEAQMPSTARTTPAPAQPAPAPANHAERAQACGWFDSSYELERGLQVRELLNPVTPLWRWAARTQA
jgi:hypothetical protein